MLRIGRAPVGLCPRADSRARAARYASSAPQRMRPLHFSSYGAVKAEGGWLRCHLRSGARQKIVVQCKNNDKSVGSVENAEVEIKNTSPTTTEPTEASEQSEVCCYAIYHQLSTSTRTGSSDFLSIMLLFWAGWK